MAGFSDTCSQPVTNTYGTCGTVTRSLLATLSPDQILALFQPGGKWAELDSLLKNQIEMRACGVRRSAMYDWIMSSNKQGQGKLITVQRASRGPSLIQPYILARQQSIWNQDYWNLSASYDKAAYDALASNKPLSPLDAGTGVRALRIISPYGTTLHPDYFLPGKRIHVISRSAGSAWSITQWEILRAALSTSAIDVEVKLAQFSTGSATLLPSDVAAQTGLILAGINNVNDVERWCYNMLNVNTEKLVPFWYQTRRHARCFDSEYEKFFARMMADNAWYAKFQDLPLSERNRQDEMREQKEFVNAFFFGDRISDGQTLDRWGNPSLADGGQAGTYGLDNILSVSGATVDPATGGKLIARRANMIGVLPQLKACAQFRDVANQTFTIKELCEDLLYSVWRHRDSMGRPTNEIDLYTDQGTADEFMVAYIAYSKKKLGDIVRLNIDEGSHIGFPFRRFKLYKPNGVFLNVITDNFFDDIRAATPSGIETIGKFMMILDLGAGGTIYPSVLGSNRKQYTSGQIDDLAKVDATYRCVMENPTIRQTLTSETTTAVVECPKNSLVVSNWTTLTDGLPDP